MDKYPEIVTERFDSANFHINYCLSFVKKHIKGNILEVGAGCGSFTKNYLNKIKSNQITLTELDKKNFADLKERFKDNKNIEVVCHNIDKIQKEYKDMGVNVICVNTDNLKSIPKAKHSSDKKNITFL